MLPFYIIIEYLSKDVAQRWSACLVSMEALHSIPDIPTLNKHKGINLDTILLIKVQNLFEFHQSFHQCSFSVPGSHIAFSCLGSVVCSKLLAPQSSLVFPNLTFLEEHWLVILQSILQIRFD